MNYTDLLKAQKAFFLTGTTKKVDYRIAKLMQLRAAIKINYPEIIHALQKDFKKCEFETFATEVMMVLDEIEYAIKHLRKWVKPEKVATPMMLFKAKSRVYREPFGSVLVIGAWNYPFLITMSPLVGAIMAGNCCVAKPSELAPHTSIVIAKIIKETFKPAECAVVEGGVEVCTALLEQRFDLIFYTGSTQVGKIVAQAAAKHLTPIVLELGGKSPCIVDEKVNIQVAARRIVWGKFVNAGQTCVAPDYLLVHKNVKAPLLQAMKQEIKRFYGDNPIESKDFCRIINKRHFDRLSGLLNEGKILCGGEADRNQCYIAPTIIDEVTWDMPIMQDEIFGPLLPVIEYEQLTEMVNQINQREKPLALYIFSEQKAFQKRCMEEISYGGGCINTTLMHTGNMHLPFGGVGYSGMGSYHGKWSFETFSHKKGVLERDTRIDIPLIYAPYKEKVLSLMKRLYKL